MSCDRGSTERDGAMETGEPTFGFLVTEEAVAFSLLEVGEIEAGDLLVEDVGDTFARLSGGVAVVGLVLTEQQRASLRPVAFVERGLDYELVSLGELDAGDC